MDTPVTKESLLSQVDVMRDLSRRARRLATSLAAEADRARLIRYSEELEANAARLEREAADAKSGVLSRTTPRP
jgi:hypothetical protein